MRAFSIFSVLLLSACSLNTTHPEQASPQTPASTNLRLQFKSQLERQLLVELWIHLNSQRESLERRLQDDVSWDEAAAIREVLAEVEEQLALTLSAIGDD